MSTMRMFLPLTKVDAVNRLVYVTATEEIADRAGEILDYAKSKPYFEAWSAEIAKASEGKSLGNVRAMHGQTAAGKLTELNFLDPQKRIDVCIKVVDSNEWEKVQEGVYTGVSIGGSYVGPRIPDPNNPALKRYIADPHEISLVDLPCLPTATFQLIKSIGVVSEVEVHAFKSISNEDGINQAFEKYYKGEYDAAITGEPLEKMTIEEAGRVGPDDHVGAPGRDDQHKPTSVKTETPVTEGGGSSDAAPATPSTAKVPNREKEEDEGIDDDSLPDDGDTHEGDPGGSIAGADPGPVHSIQPGTGSAGEGAGSGAPASKSAGETSATQDAVIQMWITKDGKPFRKKAEALAWNDELAQAELARNIGAPAQSVLDALGAALDRVDGGALKIKDAQAHDAAWQEAQKGTQTRAGAQPLGKAYDSIDEIPAAIKSHFGDTNKQRQWMFAWNDVFKKTKNEQQAFAQAWATAEKSPTQAELDKAATTPSKYGDVEYADPGFQGDKKRYPLDTEKHVRAAWSYIHMPKNAAKYSSTQLGHIKGKIAGAWKKTVGSEAPDATKAMGSAFIKMVGENLSKHLYDVGEVACMILRLNDLKNSLEHEAIREGDDMKMAAELEANVASLSEFLRNLVEEETEELVMGTEDLTGWDDNEDGDSAALQIFVRSAVGPNALALAKIFRDTIIKHEDEQVELAKGKGLQYNRGGAIRLVEAMEKVGQRLGQVNRMHLQAAHDHIASMTDGECCEEGDAEKWQKVGAKMSKATKDKLKAAHGHLSDLGADCSMGKGAYLLSTRQEVHEFEKGRGLGGGALSKILDENTALRKVVTNLTSGLTEMKTRIEKIEAQPEPTRGLRRMPPGSVAVTKGQEDQEFVYNGERGQPAVVAYNKYFEGLSEDQRTLELIKLSQRSPVIKTTM